jgi:hypothetical protein
MSNYRREYELYERRSIWTVPRVFLAILVLGMAVIALGFILGGASDAANVVSKEFAPSALLTKYEWFKDASAQLDKKLADISVYDRRTKNLEATYKGIARAGWPRDDREQLNIWDSEVAGIKASYNSLAAEYNSQMSKFNYRFTNVGDLPAGATQPLPREYKPYVTE